MGRRKTADRSGRAFGRTFVGGPAVAEGVFGVVKEELKRGGWKHKGSIHDMGNASSLSEIFYCVRNRLRIYRGLLMDIESYVGSAEASLFGRSLHLVIWIYLVLQCILQDYSSEASTVSH